MKSILLPPIKEEPSDFERMEKLLAKIFRDSIFLPLIRELGAPKRVLRNSMDDLIDAIRSSQITYYRGKFSGHFTAEISRELKRLGAIWNRKLATWDIPRSAMSFELRTTIDASEAKFAQVGARLDKKLEQILPEEIADKLSIQKLFDATLWKTDKKIQATMKGLTVSPDLTPEGRAKFAAEYTENMDKYIKDWAEEEIIELRKLLRSSVTTGFRYESMVSLVQSRYDVSLNKAKFLARQETNLMMTKFKEIRYTGAGVNEYKWGCVAGSKGHEVRPMHKALENKIFQWNNPPITNPKGERNNPGEDFNCRCFARPIVKF